MYFKIPIEEVIYKLKFKGMPALFNSEEDLYDFFEYFTGYYADSVVESIYDQVFGDRRYKVFEPLSEKYLKRKKKLDLDLGFWVATGFLRNNIKSFIDKHKLIFSVGVDEKTRHPMTGTSLGLIVRANEYGTKHGISSRPVFRMTLKKCLGRIKTIYNEWQKLKKKKPYQELFRKLLKDREIIEKTGFLPDIPSKQYIGEGIVKKELMENYKKKKNEFDKNLRQKLPTGIFGKSKRFFLSKFLNKLNIFSWFFGE